MTFTETLLDGNEKAFRPHTLTPMQKLTLRFVIVGLVFYGFAAIEGMIMRLYQIEPFSIIGAKQYFGILTAHPAGGDLRLHLPARVRGLPVPRALPDEEAAVELPPGQLDPVADRRGDDDLLAGRLHLPLRPAVHPLLAAPGRLRPVPPAVGGDLHRRHRPDHGGHALLRAEHLQDHHLHPGGRPSASRPGALLASALGFTGLANLFRRKEQPQGAPRRPPGGGHRPGLGGHGPQRPGHHRSPGS